MTKVGVQLYSFRNHSQSLPEIIHLVDEHGFEGIEFGYRIYDEDALAVRDTLDETGIEPVGAHVNLSKLESDGEDLLELFESLGCTRLIIPYLPSTAFLTQQRIDELVGRLEELARWLADNGFELLIHNNREMHLPLLDRFRLDGLVEAPFLPRGGWNHVLWGLDRLVPVWKHRETAFSRLAAESAPGSFGFEIDVKHVVAAGGDPSEVFDLAADRMPIVHISDLARRRWLPPAFEPAHIGEGLVDVERDINDALARNVDWLIFEIEVYEELHELLQRAADACGPHLPMPQIERGNTAANRIASPE